MAGVRNVHNHLQVVLPNEDYRDDAILTTTANNALALNVTVPDGVEATARDGNLTLTGAVEYGRHRNAAELAVAGLPGVRNIKDDIGISYDADPVDVTWLVQDALDRNALVDGDSDVSVDTSGNTVTLRGHVRTAVGAHPAAAGQAGRWAASVARHVRPGIDPDKVAETSRRLASQARSALTGRAFLASFGFAAGDLLFDLLSLDLVFLALRYQPAFGPLAVAYAAANIASAIPLTPGGLGVIEVTLVAITVGFGAPRATAVLAVLGYRIVNYWLPLLPGAVAYLRLRLRAGADARETVKESPQRRSLADRTPASSSSEQGVFPGWRTILRTAAGPPIQR